MASAKSNRTSAQINRRALLSALPAAALVPAAALSGEVLPPITETPVMRLFREWDAIYQFQNGETGHLTDDEFNTYSDRRIEMEDRVLGMPVEGPSDFAAKVVMLTNYGDHDLRSPEYYPEFWAEARALVAA